MDNRLTNLKKSPFLKPFPIKYGLLGASDVEFEGIDRC